MSESYERPPKLAAQYLIKCPEVNETVDKVYCLNFCKKGGTHQKHPDETVCSKYSQGLCIYS